ncbi:uracil-DNA glycosylase [Aquiluna sp.]|jgi:uracil-DNA glycosylase|nr:uracil-DNA glycosylase [Aquiluna sp.]
MFEQLHPRWQELLADQSEALEAIAEKLHGLENVVPAKENILRAFAYPPEHYRVLIVGQDPYPSEGHATGLSFCVPPNTDPLPPTLRNIIRELRDDLGHDQVRNADISVWADRGVMMLNRNLTTLKGRTAAHFDIGWEDFTAAAIASLQTLHKGRLVAILWGQRAISIKEQLAESKIIESPHPSPLSSYRGFFGSKPFSRTNVLLAESGLELIDWSC